MSSSYSLSDFDLRPTPCRLDVLSTFQGFDYALSQGDIEQKLSDKYCMPPDCPKGYYSKIVKKTMASG